MFFWVFFTFVNNCEKHISFKMWTNLFTSKNHLLTALRALSIPWWQCVIWTEQPCATAGVAVQPSQWPLWKTCYQTGQPTCATLPVDWNGAEGGQRIACIPMITHAARWGCRQLLSLAGPMTVCCSTAVQMWRLSYLSVTGTSNLAEKCGMLFTGMSWYCAACGCESR